MAAFVFLARTAGAGVVSADLGHRIGDGAGAGYIAVHVDAIGGAVKACGAGSVINLRRNGAAVDDVAAHRR